MPILLLYAIGIHFIYTYPVITVLSAILSAGLIIRAFMLQHDCSHGTFFKSAKANGIVGFLIGIVTLTPHACWRRFHLMHHAGNGNLQKRGYGDVKTLTVAEYTALSPVKKWQYRIYRHPLILFGLGAFLFFLVRQRLTYRVPKSWTKERWSIHGTSLCIVIVTLLVAVVADNPWQVLFYHVGVMFVATGAGVWLFYIQHQFPDAYWEGGSDWSFHEAALEGSSFYDLPPVLHWLTANIGYHHIHHLNVNVPNYNLPKCYSDNDEFKQAKRFTLRESLKFSQLKLWDEEKKKMVSFREVKQASLS